MCQPQFPLTSHRFPHSHRKALDCLSLQQPFLALVPSQFYYYTHHLPASPQKAPTHVRTVAVPSFPTFLFFGFLGDPCSCPCHVYGTQLIPVLSCPCTFSFVVVLTFCDFSYHSLGRKCHSPGFTVCSWTLNISTHDFLKSTKF